MLVGRGSVVGDVTWYATFLNGYVIVPHAHDRTFPCAHEIVVYYFALETLYVPLSR